MTRVANQGKQNSKYTPLFTKYESNILTIVTGSLASVGLIIILIIMIKQIRLQSLVASPRIGEPDTIRESFVFD